MIAPILALAALATAAPAQGPHHASLSTAGFIDASIKTSVSGAAICVSGKIPVTATATQLKIDWEVPHNQSGVTKTLLDFQAPGTTYLKDTVAGKVNVSGTYNINAQLCFPPGKDPKSVKGVHVTTHGGGFDGRYWDFAPSFSYIDTAVANDWAVLNYDRIGWGASDTPDPVAVVQFPTIVAILHELNTLLRSGSLANIPFDIIVGVGHSFGSITSGMINSYHPTDWNATILTGYSVNLASGGEGVFFASLDGRLANQFDPYRFPPSKYADGYITIGSETGIEHGFMYPYNYPPWTIAEGFAASYGLTWGELITLFALGQANATEYTAPLAVVNGVQDLPNCMSNCSYPYDQAAHVLPARYSAVDASKFDSVLIDGVGHGLNLHYQAEGAYEWIMMFLEKQGIGA